MRGNQLNQLASSYKYINDKRELNRLFTQISSHCEKLTSYMLGKYLYYDFNECVSVVNETLLSALNSYDIKKGSFSSHYLRWLSANLLRSKIKNRSGIKLPEYLAKKDWVIDGRIKDMISRNMGIEYIMDFYGLTKSQYNSLAKYYRSCIEYYNKPMAYSFEDSLDDSLDIDNLINNIDDKYRLPAAHYFGLPGYEKMDKKTVRKKFKVNVDDVLDYLKGNEKLISLLEGYYE